MPNVVAMPGLEPGRSLHSHRHPLARQAGLEPATCGFGDRCATSCTTAARQAYHATGDNGASASATTRRDRHGYGAWHGGP